MRTLLPPGWPKPKGYANGVELPIGRTIMTGGVVGWNEAEQFESDAMIKQFAHTLRNIVAILEAGKSQPHHIVRMTCYVTSIEEYLAGLKEIGAAWREIIGDHYPAMALVEVVRLVHPSAKVEIEATAVVPE